MMSVSIPAVMAATLVALVTIGACGLLRGNVRARVRVLRVAVLALVGLPLLPYLPFNWPVPAFDLGGRRIELPAQFLSGQVASAAHTSGDHATPAAAVAGSASAIAAESNHSASLRLHTVIPVVWLLGVLMVLAHLAAGLIQLERHARRAQPVSAGWLEFARTRLPGRMRLRILRGGPFPVAVCWGIRRTTILLPASSAAWPAAHLQIVLTHELAHAARRDSVVLLLARIAVALYWYNPLVWRVQAQLGRDTEELCDDVVLRAGVSPVHYAHVLLDAVRAARRHRRFGAVPAMARAGFLERRIERVLAGVHPPRHRWAGLAGALAVITTTLAAAFAVPATSPSPREVVAFVADDQQDDMVAALIRALADPAADVRRSAVNSLRDIGDARGIAALRGVLDDPDTNVRMAAETVLGLRPPRPNKALPPATAAPSAAAALLDSLATQLNHPDYRARLTAARALGNLGDERSTFALAARLNDPHAQVRAAAAAALGNVADARATPVLVRAWPDPDDHVRASTASALGSIGDVRGARVVIAALSDAEAHVRQVAAEALGKLGRGNSKRATQAPAACTSGGDADWELAAAVETLLRDPAAERRHAAAHALGQFDSGELAAPVPAGVKDPLHALAAGLSDPAGSVRIAAACSLARVGDERALEMLELRTRSREPVALQEAARWAIRSIERRTARTTP